MISLGYSCVKVCLSGGVTVLSSGSVRGNGPGCDSCVLTCTRSVLMILCCVTVLRLGLDSMCVVRMWNGTGRLAGVCVSEVWMWLLIMVSALLVWCLKLPVSRRLN